MPSMKDLYELQTGGYPLGQVLVLDATFNGDPDVRVCAFFADVETDVFMVEYSADGIITFQTENLGYICTDPEQLATISALTPQAQTLHEELDQHLDDDGQLSGHEYLITLPKAES